MSVSTLSEIDSKKELLRQMYCKGASDQEFELFAHICKKTGLDPISKQIYMIPHWDKNLGKNVMTTVTSIDGYRVIAERTGNYAPGKAVEYMYGGEGQLVSATAFVKKLTKDGTWHEIAATAFWNEYAQISKKTGQLKDFWAKMPHVMLAKCAESLALRRAFPTELSGLYTQEEMQNAVTLEEIPEPIITQDQVDEILETIGDDHNLLKRFQEIHKNLHAIPQKDFGVIIHNLKQARKHVS